MIAQNHRTTYSNFHYLSALILVARSFHLSIRAEPCNRYRRGNRVLISNRLGSDQDIHVCRRRRSRTLVSILVDRSYLVASTFHDLGYCWIYPEDRRDRRSDILVSILVDRSTPADILLAISSDRTDL